MNKREISTSSTGRLIAIYAEAAATHGKATEEGDYKTANKMADRIAAIYSELRGRGVEAQKELLTLLDSGEPAVRLWAASHTLEFEPTLGEPVLVKLATVQGSFIAFDAGMALKLWRQGQLRFP